MLEKQRFITLGKLAWPIAMAMLASNLLLVVDTAMVGRLGPNALAGVAIAGVLANMFFTSVAGLFSAVLAIASRRIGEGAPLEASVPLHSAQWLAVIVGIPASLLGQLLAPWLFSLYGLEPAVAEVATSYFSILCWVIPGLGISEAFRGFFNGIGKTKVYMHNFLFLGAVNIFLNWVLIFGNLGAPKMGAAGAALASVIAAYASLLTYTWFAVREGQPFGFGKGRPNQKTLGSVARLAIPASIQQLFGGLASLVFFSILSTLGTLEMAACTVVYRLVALALLPAIGLAMAAASLVGRSLGEGDVANASSWGSDTLKIASLFMALMGLPMLIAPSFMGGLFISDPDTLAVMAFPMRLSGATLGLNGCLMVLMQCLNGAGDQKYVLQSTTGYNWLIGTPILLVAALFFNATLPLLWTLHMANFAVLSLLLFRRWQSGGWQKKEV